MESKVKWYFASLSRGEFKKLKKIRETKQRRVAKELLHEELGKKKWH